MSDAMLGPSIQGYQPLARMQDKAAQLRAELEAVSKSDRHAQFKRSSSRNEGSGAGGGPSGGQSPPSGGQGSSPSRRFLRTVASAAHSSHSVSAMTPANGASFERPPSASALASRMSSRRASNASGGATDASGDEPRLTNSGGVKSPPSRRGTRTSRPAAFRDMHDYAAAISRQNQLEDTVAELEDRVRTLSTDNERRQESYMRREAQLQDEVARLEEQLRKARGEHPENASFGKASANIRELHTQVVSQIEDLLTAQAATFRQEEHSTLRRFTTRLNELEAAVVSERTKGLAKEDMDSLEKVKVLRHELDKAQQIAQILDKKHTVASEENSRLKAQFKLQEEDRDYLIKQTVALKKENAALRNQLAALMQDVAALSQEKEELMAAAAASEGSGFLGGSSGAGAAGSGGGGGGGRPGSSRGVGAAAAASPDGQIQIKIQRYEDVIDSLKRLLEAERRRTKQARAAHTLELQQRTGLQAVLRQCVEDVRERRRALEADGHRERSAIDRAHARGRPISGLRHAPAASPVSRPLSAMLLPSSRRPGSAALASTGTRPSSGRATYDAGDGGEGSLTAGQRGELVAALLANEEVLRVVFDKAFPGVAPHPPSDPYLDRMAAWQEQRDAQVVANAKVLAAAKNAVLPPATAVKESTPGGMLLKEAAARPWVLNVDAMLSDFLGGTGPAGVPGSSKSGGGGAPGGSAGGQ